MKNWKTSLAALLFAIATLANLFGYITGEQLTGMIGLLGAFGFAFSKDFNVSGSKKPEVSADDFVGDRPDERK